MAAQKGRDFLIKIDDETSSPTAFNTLMGVRSRTILINNEIVDITDSNNAPWRTLLEDSGLRTLTITASGVFKDDAAFNTLQNLAHLGTIKSFLIQFGNSDTLDGEFQVSSLEESAEHVGEQTYSVTLEASGQWFLSRA